MKQAILIFLILTGCACSAAQTEADRCLFEAQNRWRLDVAQCAAEGKDAKACELDRLTAERKDAEEGCIDGNKGGAQ